MTTSKPVSELALDQELARLAEAAAEYHGPCSVTSESALESGLYQLLKTAAALTRKQTKEEAIAAVCPGCRDLWPFDMNWPSERGHWHRLQNGDSVTVIRCTAAAIREME